MRSKLLRIDKNTAHHNIIMLTSLFVRSQAIQYNLNQTKMTIMKSAHSRNKSNSRETMILLVEFSNHLVSVFSNSFNTTKAIQLKLIFKIT